MGGLAIWWAKEEHSLAAAGGSQHKHEPCDIWRCLAGIQSADCWRSSAEQQLEPESRPDSELLSGFLVQQQA